MPDMGDVLFAQHGGFAVAMRDRREALHAVSLGMDRTLEPHLAASATDARTGALLLRGAG